MQKVPRNFGGILQYSGIFALPGLCSLYEWRVSSKLCTIQCMCSCVCVLLIVFVKRRCYFSSAYCLSKAMHSSVGQNIKSFGVSGVRRLWTRLRHHLWTDLHQIWHIASTYGAPKEDFLQNYLSDEQLSRIWILRRIWKKIKIMNITKFKYTLWILF